ncbi:MAG: restriction endonuclease [Candidatus Microthrix sp.]|jgi:hypothetical protein|uniref:restriction endonuclease n=1 Tax=Candidatus Neomicrothrix sp. TaxID=2719034 RepID=UPI001B4F886F|nr:restriction endonuclease [Candidatus Microthrix sp.]MBP7996323.1 restriction endonuclease [Candidatus Microthrix sp.]
MRFDDIAQWRLDIFEASLGLESERDLQHEIEAPRKALGEYEHLLRRKRRALVRSQLDRLVAQVDATLASTNSTEPGRREFVAEANWAGLRSLVGEFDRLVGDELPQATRHSDLHRHLRFAEPNDLEDTVELDWPNIRSAAIELALEGETLKVEVADLGALVDSQPTGPVSSALDWSLLDAEQFERLIFNLLQGSPQYENVEWLMHTNAPDRARDVSADRIDVDELTGTRRTHVLVQCKHWRAKSIGVEELNNVLAKSGLWSKSFRTVIVATSGTFTQDAVEWREKRELANDSPRVDLWSKSHLEHLLAARPALRSASF